MNAVRGSTVARVEPFVDSRYFLAPVGATGWLAGIWLASKNTIDVGYWLALAVPFVLGAVVAWRRGRIGLILAFCAALCLGAARYVSSQPPLSPEYVHYYNGAADIVITGAVSREPAIDDTRARLRVAVAEVALDGQSKPAQGTIQVETGRYPEIPYGATVRLAGDLSSPFILGNPGYTAYLERQGIRGVMRFPAIEVTAEGGGSGLYRALLRIRERGRDAIKVSLPEPHAALLTGILLGDSSGLPRELSDDFRETGMTHIIAISGFNIAIIIGMLDLMTAPVFPRRTAAILIMVIIGLYALLVGASASVVRAALMGITYLIGIRLMGRPTYAVAGLFTAAFLMTLAHPEALWDVGFQLSFAATLGLVLYAGPWSRRLDRGAPAILAPEVRGRVLKVLAEVVVVTLAAQVLTLPLILYHFGRLSLASLPANFLVLPAQTGVMASGGLMLALGLLSPVAGQIAGLLA